MKKLILAVAVSLLCIAPISNAQAHGKNNNRNYAYAEQSHHNHYNNNHRNHYNHGQPKKQKPVVVEKVIVKPAPVVKKIVVKQPPVKKKVVYVYERPHECHNKCNDSLEKLLIEALLHISRN